MNFSESERLEQVFKRIYSRRCRFPFSFFYKAVGGGAPVVMKEGHGAYLYDVDGNKFIDYLQAYGPIIAGHAHPHITKAIQEQAAKGVLFGTPTELEIELAKNYVMQFHLLRKFACKFWNRSSHDNNSCCTCIY